ncbi:hypothetical protein LACWKB10_0902 [Lactobacillus sp. wkB10]|nr:hypothetical protein LACWKB10_0902 [Lactobacillus sp. wkB10]
MIKNLKNIASPSEDETMKKRREKIKQKQTRAINSESNYS